jgi:hypothetical protein
MNNRQTVGPQEAREARQLIARGPEQERFANTKALP